MNPPQGLGTSPRDGKRLTPCLGVLAAEVKAFWLPHGSWGCWLLVPFWHTSVRPLPACVPELLSPVGSLLPVPGPLFHPAAQGFARAKHCTLESLAGVCVFLPVPRLLVGWGTESSLELTVTERVLAGSPPGNLGAQGESVSL